MQGPPVKVQVNFIRISTWRAVLLFLITADKQVAPLSVNTLRNSCGGLCLALRRIGKYDRHGTDAADWCRNQDEFRTTTTVTTVEGDLLKLALEGEFDVIVHGCNCQCTMGAGIAEGVRLLFPEAYQADMETKKGDRQKLGTISGAFVVRGEHQLAVVNAYTQFHWSGQGVLADYGAIRSVFRAIKQRLSGKRIGYPMIGTGLAKGDWNVIGSIINEELEGEQHTLVVYAP